MRLFTKLRNSHRKMIGSYSSDIIDMLNSTKISDIEKALSEVKTNKSKAPSREIINAIMKLFKHDDSEIRHDAVFAIGLHWIDKSIFYNLIDLLEIEKSNEVIEIIVASIGAIAFQNENLQKIALKRLCKIVLDEKTNNTIRAIAYNEICRINGKYSIADYATAPEDINELQIDLDMLRELI